MAARLAGGAGGLGSILSCEGWKEVGPQLEGLVGFPDGPADFDISASNLEKKSKKLP